ncbi:MAG: archease [Armatimonadota bacterium]|nr:archease [Armatimonadota bacterium]MDR7386049.1 archease [Armatimonadota bacterium]MDR7389335.1 archease [Armatimonadota bacterium]MDR7391774.1 archease [Armatimonadota bacterium]MDR7393955.1 archease [Armatimonadota bacterium]
MPVEVLEHTAEVGLRARAGALESLLEDLAAGLFSLITDPQTVQEREAWQVEVQADDLTALAVEWLNELLFLHARDGMLARRCTVHEVGGGRLRATVWGERFDPGRHPRGIEVKSATYHQARVEPSAGGWTAVVYLDV